MKNLEQLKGDCRALGLRAMETKQEHVPAMFSTVCPQKPFWLKERPTVEYTHLPE